jgi:glutathione synthase/RimK-type ligase-like ATP-grasp enzyme
LIVLDNHVIDSIEYRAPTGDFRSNVGESPAAIAKIFTKEIQKIAIEAVSSLHWEFGGVDILLDASDAPYVTEVNLPCFFPRCQDCTGTDIAGHMLEYLLRKAKRHQ